MICSRSINSKLYNTHIRELTGNSFFIEECNNRDQTTVWISEHFNTENHPLYGVLWGYRLEDKRMMIQLVLLREEWDIHKFESARFLDADRSNFLLILTHNQTMLVMNPFEGQDELVHFHYLIMLASSVMIRIDSKSCMWGLLIKFHFIICMNLLLAFGLLESPFLAGNELLGFYGC